jgi:hypothetical protein
MATKKPLFGVYPKEIEDIEQMSPKFEDESALVFKDQIDTEIRMSNPETGQVLGIIEKLNFEIYRKE